MASLYLELTSYFKQHSIKKFIASAFVFNCIGFVNELYQNLARHKPVFAFNFGSKLDLLVNVIGSLLFILISISYLHRQRLAQKKEAAFQQPL